MVSIMSEQSSTTGPPGEGAATIVPRLSALIPEAPESRDIATALSRLEKLREDAAGRATLDRAVELLRAAGAFELMPLAVQELLQPDPIHQTDATRGPLVRTVTAVRIRAAPQAVAAAIFDRPWSWWKNGEVLDWQRGDKVRFLLQPIATRAFGYLSLPAKPGIELSAAEETEEPTRDGRCSRKKIVFPARFFRDIVGPGRYEIVDIAGGSLLRSVWDGAERRALQVKLLPMKLFLRVHLGGEKGDLSWPLPPGTGFPGLLEMIQRPRS